jgi:hypothetical protein
MVQSFGTERIRGVAAGAGQALPDLEDAKKFIGFLFEEYLHALDLYLHGKGHHGFAGHVLTVGHALLELHRMGYPETAHKGLEAYRQFLNQARRGANLGGQKVNGPPPNPPSPLDRDYWVAQRQRPIGGIVSSHLVKYPYSFYALWQRLEDGELKERTLRTLYHLTAVS